MPAVANSYLSDAIKEYNAGHYEKAIGLFGAAEQNNFNDPVFHYYLANAYLKTNRTADAVKHYKIALAMQETGQVAEFCKAALEKLQPVSPASSAKARSATTGAESGGQQLPEMHVSECGCVMCHRLELLLTQVEAKYHGRLIIKRSDSNLVDLRKGSIPTSLKPLTTCPTVTFFDSQGHQSAFLYGDISEQELWQKIELIAQSAGPVRLTASETKIVELRTAIAEDANKRVAEAQRLLETEVAREESSARQRQRDLSHTDGNFRAQYDDISRELTERMARLNADFEKHKAEIYDEAAKRARGVH
jgi:tetratricopeptide (TPR) repeat protein